MEPIVYSLEDRITPTYIFQRIPQEQMFKKYLGFYPGLEVKFCSPFRTDRNPSCTLTYLNGKLVLRDWSLNTYYDIFDVVQKLNKVNFPKAVDMVATDFGLKEGEHSEPILPAPETIRRKSKPVFDVQVQPFTDTDIAYLEQFGITPQIASRFNTFSVKRFFINEKHVYDYSQYDPAIGYYFGLNSRGNQKWKVYSYYSSHSRFMCNTSRINGWIQLPENGELVVITKSMKDVMTLARFSIPAVALQGESIEPQKWMIDELQRRFGHVVSLYDFDRAGAHMAWILRHKYDIPAFALTDGRFGTKNFGSKDISDYVRDHGLSATEQLINQALHYGSLTDFRNTELSIAL